MLMYAPVSRPFHILAASAETLPLLPPACTDVYESEVIELERVRKIRDSRWGTMEEDGVGIP